MAAVPLLIMLSMLAFVNGDRAPFVGCWRVTAPQESNYYTDQDCTQLPLLTGFQEADWYGGHGSNGGAIQSGSSGKGSGFGNGQYGTGLGSGGGGGNGGGGGGLLAPGSFGPNGPAMAHSVVQTVNAFAQVFSAFARTQEEVNYRYMPSHIPVGKTPEQKAREYQKFNDELYREQVRENNRRSLELTASPDSPKWEHYQKNFQSVMHSWAEQVEKSKIAAKYKFTSEIKPRAGAKEVFGKRAQALLNKASSLKQVDENQERADFIIGAARIADQRSEFEFLADPVSQRWLDRGERAYSYWSSEKVRLASGKLQLSSNAQNTFGLPNIVSNSFENYEIISAANTLSRESKITSNEERRLRVALALNQAQVFAEEGEVLASALMLENAYSIRDFARGIASGIEQNVYDSITGLWHLVRHPVEAATALKDALINYDKTYDLIVARAQEVVDNFDSFSSEEKGRLVGYLATELLSTVGTGGASWTGEIAKAARLAQGVEAALEEATKLLKTPGLNKFEAAVSDLSDVGKKNVEFLRSWAKEQGYVMKPNPLGKPEEWGVLVEGVFEWRLKLKPVSGIRQELHANSKVPRASVRISKNEFVNPFRGEKVDKIFGSHLPLERDWSL